MKEYAHLLFTIGKIGFFEIKPSSFQLFKNAPTYCWKDTTLYEFHGPFNSIQEAVNHCQALNKVAKLEPIQNIPQNVIVVNFQTKRRIQV